MVLVPLFDFKFLTRTRSSLCRNFKSAALATSMALEDGFALFDKGFGGFLVVGGLARARVMDCLGVEAGFQRQMLGVVDVALDVAERYRRALRQRHRQIMRRRFDLGVGNDTRHHSERE